MLNRSGLTFQGLNSLDGAEPGGLGGRDFVYTARLEADRFGRPAPVTQWPGLGLEDPSSAAAAINAWIDPAKTKSRAAAAGDEAGATAERATTTDSAAGETWPVSDGSTEEGSETDTESRTPEDEDDDEFSLKNAGFHFNFQAAISHGAAEISSQSGWDHAAANPMLSGGGGGGGAPPHMGGQQDVWHNPAAQQTRDRSSHTRAAAALQQRQHQPRQLQQVAPPAANGKTGKEKVLPACPFCPAAYDESVGANPSRKTRRIRPKAVSRTTQKHGRWWQTLGYSGPAYCQRCSEVFRDHIIRQKPNSAECTRDQPCDECAALLSHFSGGVAVLWQRIDARSYAEDSNKKKGKGAHKRAAPAAQQAAMPPTDNMWTTNPAALKQRIH